MAGVIRRRLAPWAGVIGAAAGWYVGQQAGANAVFAECNNGHWWSVALIELAALALVGGGAAISYRSWREQEETGWRFVALLGMAVAAVLSFPILMEIVAGVVVPGCVS